MKVSELIEILHDYNPDARVAVVAHNREQPFTLSFGGSDGGSKKDALTVDFCADALNTREG